MGQIITQFTYERRSLPETEFLLDKSLSKIEEYYSKYKAISDSLAIDDTEFQQIFQISHSIFDLLDTRKNLLIDGLEMFSGMALFSRAVNFENKVEFIFQLYDFNKLNSLSITDLEFMFLSCCSVTHKLFGIKTSLRQQIIIDYVHEEFQEGQRINISEIKKWANKSEILKQFLVIINNFNMKNKDNYAKQDQLFFSNKIYQNLNNDNELNAPNKLNRKKQEINHWLYQTHNYFNSKLTNQKMLQCDIKMERCDVNLSTDWVYGIRYRDVKYFIEFVSENQIAYFIGKIVVIFNLKSNKQRHYNEHRNTIVSLAFKNNMIATSEENDGTGDFTEIRIWDLRTLGTSKVLKGFHKSGIHLLKFSTCGEYLITAGNAKNSPIIIYHVNSAELIYSCYCQFPTVQISLINDLTYQQTSEIVIASLYTLKCFQIEKTNPIPTIHQFDIKNQRNKNEFMDSIKYLSPITCCSAIKINKSLKYLSRYDKETEKLIITGHESGEIYVWSFEERILFFLLGSQNSEITQILCNQNQIIISHNSSYLNFWDINLHQKQKNQTIDITTLVSSAQSYEIATVIQDTHNNYLIVTIAGELIRLKKEKKKDNCLRFQIFGSQYQGKLIRNIINIEESICGHKILTLNDSTNLLLYATNLGNIVTINLASHTVLMKWKLGEKIVCFDCYEQKEGGIEIIAGTIEKRIYFNSNLIEHPRKFQMEKGIKCLKYCCDNPSTLAVALEDATLHFISIAQIENKLKQIQSIPKKPVQEVNLLKNLMDFASSLSSKKETNQKVKSSEQVNRQVQFTIQNTLKKLKLPSNIVDITILEKKMVIFITEQNKVYLLSLKDYFFKVVDEDNPVSANYFKEQCFVSYYSIRKKNRSFKIPILLGPNPRIFLACDLDGSLKVWKNSDEILFQNVMRYSWHSKLCISVSINKAQSKLITCGEDRMITESSVLYFFLANRNVVEPGRSLISKDSNFEMLQEDDKLANFTISDTMLERQFAFSTFQNQITTELYDQHLLIRGLEDETLRKFMKNLSIDWKSINNHCDMTKAPSLSLKLDYVLGVETFNKRNTIVTISDPFRIVYFVSNVIIVFNPPQNRQNIYRGHRYRVTCLTKVNNNLIASGEAAYKAQINIWNCQTLETIKKLMTCHKYGIINICCVNNYMLSYGIFNKENRIFSLEMHDMRTGQSIANKKLQQAIYSMAINPLRKNQFVTTSEKCITFWKIGNTLGQFFSGNIQKHSVIEVQSPVTACFFKINTFSSFGVMEKKTELVIGNKSGALGIITGGFKLILLQEKAHSQQINCIQYINYDDLQSDETTNNIYTKNIRYIVTTAEDESIKIWNRQFELLYEKQICKIDFEDNHNFSGISPSCLGSHSDKILEKNVSAQSISAMITNPMRQNRPFNPGKVSNTRGLFLVLGIRNGDIIILKDYEQVNYQENKNRFRPSKERKSLAKRNRSSKKVSLRKSRLKQMTDEAHKTLESRVVKLETKNNDSQAIVKKIRSKQDKIKKQQITYYLLLRTHSSQKSIVPSNNENLITTKGKVLFTHHPNYQLVVTIASDQNLLLWDTQRNLLIMSRALSYMAEPTAIKFTKEGEILIIGHSDGSLLLLDFLISDINQGKGGQKYMLPSLKILKKIKQDQSCAVLNIQLSDSGDYMAVSYNNKFNRETSEILESSHLKIYVNKSREKVKKTINSRIEFNGMFQLNSTIPCQKSQSHYVTLQKNKYGMAAYWMIFTENEGKTYLLIYQQLVDSHHKRLNYTKNGLYTLWDVNTSTVITTIDSSFSFNWKKLCIPNSVHCRYQLYSNITAQEQSNLANQDVGVTVKQKKIQINNDININSNLLVPYISSMINLPKHLVLGSVNGDLHLAQITCLDYDEMFEHFPSKDEMFMAKTYPGHCSEINHIEVNNHKNLVYTSSVSGKSIFKWKIEGSSTIQISNYPKPQKIMNEEVSQQDKNIFMFENSDVFGEIPNPNNLQLLQKLYHAKNTLRAQKFFKGITIKNKRDYKQYIRPLNIIGRKAHDVRNNLFYDQKAGLVYNTGHCIVNKRIMVGSQKNLHFLYSDNQQQNIEEINLIQLNTKRNIIYSCHKGLHASICIWQVFTKIRLKTIHFYNLIQILKLRVSFNEMTGIIYGINHAKEPILMMIEFESEMVLGVTNFLGQPIWELKDIVFYPNTSHKFVTCGLRQVLKWENCGTQLVYETSGCPFIENKNKTISICVQFTKKYHSIVTGCQDGSIAIWDSNKFVKKDHNDMIMILKSHAPNLLLGGSKDGYILLWVQQNDDLTFISKISLDKTKISRQLMMKTFKNVEKKTLDMQNLQDASKKRINNGVESKDKNKQFAIQSLDIERVDNNQKQDENNQTKEIDIEEAEFAIKKNMYKNMEESDKENFEENQANDKKKGKWKILIGTINGDILQAQIQKKIHNVIQFQTSPSTILSYYDQNIPKAFFFSMDDTKIFEITNEGHFYCRNISNSVVLYEHSFNLKAIDMLYSEKTDTIFCIFDSEVKLLSLSYPDLNDISINFHSNIRIKFITHAILSCSGKLLGICEKKNSDNSINVIVYDVAQKTQPKQLLRFTAGNDEAIQLVDFSRNNKIILVKMQSGKIFIKDMFKIDKIIKQDAIRFIQWSDSAQKLFDLNLKLFNKIDKTSKLEKPYKQESNQEEHIPKQINESLMAEILKIQEISDNIFLVADIYGNIEVYTKTGNLISQSNVRITYSSMVRLSKSKKLIGVGSEINRNIVVFDISLCLKSLS